MVRTYLLEAGPQQRTVTQTIRIKAEVKLLVIGLSLEVDMSPRNVTCGQGGTFQETVF